MKNVEICCLFLVTGSLLVSGSPTQVHADECDPISCGADVTGGIGAGSVGGTTSISSPSISNPALTANYGQNSAYEAYPSMDPGGFYSGSEMSRSKYTFSDNTLQTSAGFELAN